MGMFKQMKDAKKMVEAAPGLVDQSMKMAGQAQEMAAAQQAAAQQAAAQQSGAAPAAAGPDSEPIDGVSLADFAAVCRDIGANGNDQSKGPELAAARGITAESWQAALAGWNARIAANPAVAQQFNAAYRAG